MTSSGLTILKAYEYDIPDKDTATYQDQECVPSDHCTARVISTESRAEADGITELFRDDKADKLVCYEDNLVRLGLLYYSK